MYTDQLCPIVKQIKQIYSPFPQKVVSFLVAKLEHSSWLGHSSAIKNILLTLLIKFQLLCFNAPDHTSDISMFAEFD
jgi:hypothetical protein